MGLKERRILEREQIKSKIFDAASEIIIDEGLAKLSIRKIADKIEYSPGVIYNYFKDKNERVELLIDENIQRICSSMLELQLEQMNPKEALKVGLTTFANAMLENRQQYRAIMMSGINLSLFREDTARTNELRERLVFVLKSGIDAKVFELQNEEITTMIFLASMFGVMNTLVQEEIEKKDVSDVIIQRHIEILINGISK